jgi:hypothetical protein
MLSTKTTRRIHTAILLEPPHFMFWTAVIPGFSRVPRRRLHLPVEPSLPSPLLLHLAPVILASIALVELFLHSVQLSRELCDLRFQFRDRLRVHALALITIAHSSAPARPAELPKRPRPKVLPTKSPATKSPATTPAAAPAKLRTRPAIAALPVSALIPAPIT